MTANQHQLVPLEKRNCLEAYLILQNVALTRQELNVLYWSMEGKTNAEIAEALGISPSTIKAHKNNLIAKLGLTGRVDFQKYLLAIAKNPP